jgi:hypothetical protein
MIIKITTLFALLSLTLSTAAYAEKTNEMETTSAAFNATLNELLHREKELGIEGPSEADQQAISAARTALHNATTTHEDLTEINAEANELNTQMAAAMVAKDTPARLAIREKMDENQKKKSAAIAANPELKALDDATKQAMYDARKNALGEDKEGLSLFRQVMRLEAKLNSLKQATTEKAE